MKHVCMFGWVVALAVGCGGGDDSGGDGGATNNVTPEAGGTVVSDDGLVTLVVPPGAVTESVAVSITWVELGDAPADVTTDPEVLTYYELQPSGLQFAVPARLTAVLTSAEVTAIDLGDGETAHRMLLSRDDAGAYEALDEQEMFIDELGGVTVSGDLSHFSGIVRARSGMVWSQEPGPLDTEAPAWWTSSITLYTEPLPQDSLWRKTLEKKSLEVNHVLEEPISWTAVSKSYYGDGVVLEHEAIENELDVYVAGGEAFGTAGDHYCPVAGTGAYTLVLRMSQHPFGTETPFRNNLQVGASFPVVCRESLSTIAAGTFATAVQNAEAVTSIAADFFALQTAFTFDTDDYIAIAGSNGWAVHRLSDGQVFHDNTSPNYPLYAGFAANSSMVTIGPDGYGDARYIPSMMRFGFSQLGLLGSNITDVVPIARSPDSVHGMLLANNTADTVERLDPDIATPFGGFVLAAPVLDSELAAVPGSMVSVYSPTGEGPFLGLVDSPSFGTPGSLFWVDPQNTAGLTVVGDVGEGPRRIRCLEPAGTPCAITNYTTGSVMIADWPDRAQPPTLRATSIAVAGPVGVDLAMVNGTPTAVATGFADDTVHLISIPSGTPTDQSVPLVGCANPGHAAFVGGGSHIVVTCNGSATYQVLALPLGG